MSAEIITTTPPSKKRQRKPSPPKLQKYNVNDHKIATILVNNLIASNETFANGWKNASALIQDLTMDIFATLTMVKEPVVEPPKNSQLQKTRDFHKLLNDALSE